MATRPKAAKVSNVTTRSQTRTTNFLTTPDPIGFYLENADKRNLRLLSKESNQAFFDNLKCADAQELHAMRNEPEPCKNTAKVIYNPKKGMQRAIMCAIMSVDQKLHVYVKTEDLEPFLASVKCFDKYYALKLTLLYPTQEGPPPKPKLYCHGGFHALRLHCVDAQELEAMRQSTSLECKNFSTRMWYNPEENMQHAIMCAIISVDQTLHVYVNQEHLPQFLSSESVKCFDNNYYMRLTLLCGGDPQGVSQPEELHCHGGFRALKGRLACDGRLQDQEGVQVVRFTGNTHVDCNAFVDNSSLMELLDVNTIEAIYPRAFKSCRSLTQLGDMSALKRIQDEAFSHTALVQLGDLSSLTFISRYAFYGTDLKQLGYMPELTTIDSHAFHGTPLEQLGDMPALTEIGYGAFQDTKLMQLGDLSSLTTIGPDAFLRCTSLTKVGDMANLTAIGYGAFQRTQLTQLGDMSSLKTIGNRAFYATKLTQLGNLKSLTKIDDRAFEGCKDLEIVHLPKTLEYVGIRAFDGCPLGDLTVEPGANFECKCANLANMLRQLDGIVVTGGVPPYKIQTT